ncbi:MAG TPA: hypothetical protein VGS78_03745 [Candidatus Sulfotelmatobacter sp.]|nr:hypothetical protein [Candidatus Sulfotelmatobacter sp.]
MARKMTTKDGDLTPKEVAALLALYEHPGANFTTYTLTQVLYPESDPASPEHDNLIEEVIDSTDTLIMLGLVDGQRLEDNAGRIYRTDLDLTGAGDRKSIELRKKAASKK